MARRSLQEQCNHTTPRMPAGVCRSPEQHADAQGPKTPACESMIEYDTRREQVQCDAPAHTCRRAKDNRPAQTSTDSLSCARVGSGSFSRALVELRVRQRSCLP
eukprot:2145837-Alexandrium_andersonii.AAC.1